MCVCTCDSCTLLRYLINIIKQLWNYTTQARLIIMYNNNPQEMINKAKPHRGSIDINEL